MVGSVANRLRPGAPELPPLRFPSTVSALLYLFTVLACLTLGPGGALPRAAAATVRIDRSREALQTDPEFLAQWSPVFLYVSDDAFLVADSLRERSTAADGHGIITALGASPCSDGLVYATTDTMDSRLVHAYPESGKDRVLASASALGEDLCFRGLVSVAPGGRWLIVTTGSGRSRLGHAPEDQRGAGGGVPEAQLWLLDRSAEAPPTLLISGARLLSCDWSPSGEHAACMVDTGDPTDASAFLVATEGRTATFLWKGKGRAWWSADGCTLRGHGDAERGLPAPVHDICTGVSKEERESVSPAAWADGVRSPSGAVTARVAGEPPGAEVQVRTTSGRRRSVRPPAKVSELLGWSCRTELLSVLCEDGSLHFITGATTEAGYESIVRALPATAVSPGQPSPGRVLDMHTTLSPVKIECAEGFLAAWIEESSGPCLVYADGECGEANSLWMLRFRRMSPQELGIDTRLDIREQTIRGVCTSNLRQIGFAVFRYAKDHNGRVPPHETGRELCADLEDYLGHEEYSSLYSSPYAEGEIRVHILCPDAQWLGDGGIGEKGERAAATPIARLDGDDGFSFIYYADHTVEEIGP